MKCPVLAFQQVPYETAENTKADCSEEPCFEAAVKQQIAVVIRQLELFQHNPLFKFNHIIQNFLEFKACLFLFLDFVPV